MLSSVVNLSVAGEPQYIELFDAAMAHEGLRRFDAAVAYATLSGVEELNRRMNHPRRVSQWKTIRKHWLVALDWCRTEPIALEFLSSLPRSEVRIFHGSVVVGRPGCNPTQSFHPKAFIFSGGSAIAMVFGSANLSRNGLCHGIEIGGILQAVKPLARSEEIIWRNCQSAKRVFGKLWREATKLSEIIGDYRRIYEQKLKNPTQTEDDVADLNAIAGRHRTVNDVVLRQLRACDNFWIETGDPRGDQIQMSPLSRVFFGFRADDVQPHTSIGNIRIIYNGRIRRDCSLQWKGNGMELLTLPRRRPDGPDSYRGQVLLFTKTIDANGQVFELSIGTFSSIQAWKKKSRRIGAEVKMSKGERRWGVF